jgi:hypothetical protein
MRVSERRDVIDAEESFLGVFPKEDLLPADR